MWNTVSLENLLLVPIRNGLTKPSKVRGSGIKMIGMGEIFSYDRIPTSLEMDLVPVTEKEFANSEIIDNDLLFARQSLVLEGAGKCSIVTRVTDPAVFESHLIRLRIDEGKSNPKFLYYYFRSPQGKANIRTIVEQVAAAGIRGKDLIKLQVPNPDMDIQNRIVAVLDNIDLTIENNNRAIANMYEQIDALCNAWLVNYIPFGNEIPADWVMTSLSEIATFVGGYSYKGSELVESSNIAMATIKNFDRNGGFKLNGYKPIEPSSKLKSSQHVSVFDTLVAHTDLTQNAEVIGNAEVLLSKADYQDIVFSMDVVKVLPKTTKFSKFLIAGILRGDRFKKHCLGYVNGTTVLHLSKQALPEYELPLPKDYSVLRPLDKAITGLYHQMANLMEANISLEKLRESMIPEFVEGNIIPDRVHL